MGKRSRRRARAAGASTEPPVASSEYCDDAGNGLVLRDSLSDGTLRKLGDLDAKPAASAEDRWQRRVEFLFERLAVRWDIAGLPLESQAELLGRLRMATVDERRFVRETLAGHLRRHHPELTI